MNAWPGAIGWSIWFVAAYVISACVTRWLVGWAVARGVIDEPNARSSHTRATPRGGGLAIVGVTAAAGLVAALVNPAAWQPLAAVMVPALAVAVVSWFDDLSPLPNRIRFGVHLGSAAVAVALLEPVSAVSLGSLGSVDLAAAAWPLTLLWIVGMTNAFNFMDGIDGIAGITAAVAGATIAAAAMIAGSLSVAAVGLAFAGASAGFLVSNWPPARIFMGDVGSAFCGFMIACLPLATGPSAGSSVVPAVVFAMWPFIFDTAYTLCRRLARAENIFQAHRSHLYQRLVIAGWSHRAVSSLYGGLSAMAAVVAISALRIDESARSVLPIAAATVAVGIGLLLVLVAAAEGAQSEEASSAPATFYARVGKRCCDVVLSVALVVVALPVMALVAIAVWLSLGSPVLYHDERAGLAGRRIQITKFRSMAHATDAAGRLLPDDQRLGWFGRILRQTSLDELPQLFSVLIGDMSLVGPRPLPERYVSRYSTRQATRLLVRPGLTGWAQIHGRNAVNWPERLELDAQYVERLGRWSAPLTDLWIVAVTFIQILGQAVTGRGISAPGSATMQEFSP